MKRGGPLKRHTPLRSYTQLRSNTKLRARAQNETNDVKDEIQELCRQIAILRDGGCIFRNFRERMPFEYLECGPRRKDGELVLQFDHLNSRRHSVSYGEPRLGICACKRHHFYFKKDHPMLYMEIVRDQIGNDRWYLLERVMQSNHKATRFFTADWLKLKAGLQQELRNLQKNHA